MPVGVSRRYTLRNEASCFYFLLIHQNLGTNFGVPKTSYWSKNRLYYPLMCVCVCIAMQTTCMWTKSGTQVFFKGQIFWQKHWKKYGLVNVLHSQKKLVHFEILFYLHLFVIQRMVILWYGFFPTFTSYLLGFFFGWGGGYAC